MSWIEKVKNDFIITCGDGSEFRPNWMGANKVKDYNISEFNFPEVAGTLVKRGQPKGRKYTIDILFQGEDHLDISDQFETSADDNRAWTISHPYYGRLIVQPLSLKFDNSKYNVTRIRGEILETIQDENPKTTEAPLEQIQILKENTDTTIAESFANDVLPETEEINIMLDINSELYEEGKKGIVENVDFDNYFNAFNNARNAILNATDDAFQAMNELQAVINAPAQFVESIKNRFNVLKNQFTKLVQSVANILTRNGKKIHESTSGTLIGALTLGAVSDIDISTGTVLDANGDAILRSDIVDIIDDILDNYNQYLDDLDTLQSDDNSSPDSFIPDVDIQIALNDLVLYTVDNLLDIVTNAKQERSIILEKDSNIILLAHRFFGLKSDDSTIDELIRINNIGLNEKLQIKKGRTIIYYI